MSLLSKLIQRIAPVAATFGKLVPGVGTAVSLAGTAATAYYSSRSGPGAIGAQVIQPGVGPSMPSPITMGMFPGMTSIGRALPAIPALVGGAARIGVTGAKRVYSAAASYCRKHPQWCSTIGGIAAVEAMIGRGELPIPKRRRGKGISATELRNFRRVVKFTSKYCAPTKRAMRAPAMRRGRSSCQ